MSTRSTIARQNEDGTVTGVYCHFDGYLDGVGETLQEFWQDAVKVDALLALGDLSALGEEVGEQHSFDEHHGNKAAENWCLFYGRDRGETGIDARAFPDATTYWAARRSFGAEYQYLFVDGAWLVKAYDREIMPLSDALAVGEVDDE
jgi:hypothetical protein